MQIVKNVSLLHDFSACENPKIGETTGVKTNGESYVTVDELPCENCNFYNLPFTITNVTMNSLRVINCGRVREKEGLSFDELHRIFDGWIWLLILLSNLTVILALSQNILKLTDASVCNNFLSPVTVLLEQGGLLPNHLINHFRLKIISGGFLLIGIVLSNAYKNANVHKMIAPRYTPPCETYQELVNDGYAVYVKGELTTRMHALNDELHIQEGYDRRRIPGTNFIIHVTRGTDILKQEYSDISKGAELLPSFLQEVFGTLIRELKLMHTNKSKSISYNVKTLLEAGQRKHFEE